MFKFFQGKQQRNENFTTIVSSKCLKFQEHSDNKTMCKGLKRYDRRYEELRIYLKSAAFRTTNGNYWKSVNMTATIVLKPILRSSTF